MRTTVNTSNIENIKEGGFVIINSTGRPGVIVRIIPASKYAPTMLYVNDWSNCPANGQAVCIVLTPDEVTPLSDGDYKPTANVKDDYKSGDRVRHTATGRETTITDIRITDKVKTFGMLRKVYRLDFGESVKGPFGFELNGEYFTAEGIAELKPIRRKLDFTPESCGTCRHCCYDIDQKICICRKRNGEQIGKNQYTYICDDWER